ncbi:hypothetical protein [Lysobacter sp. CA199]|uniref:hypothetical protein n=1 Tax=Lysobacter sp. CA199 TaxID=3455608 RepID=UPI003F8D0492
MDLPQARERLLARGWKADPPKREPGSAEYLQGIIDAGYPEVEDCSGTGQGFCSFMYRNAAGDRLNLVTAGEYVSASQGGESAWPGGRHAGVTCAGARGSATDAE